MNESSPSGRFSALEETIFSAALHLRDPGERVAYLDRACAGDSQLRERVESLLAELPHVEHFMESTAHDDHLGRPASPAFAPDNEVGLRLGRYQLRERIGEGGCGIVYAADQEEPVRRRVALKIIKLGMDTRQVVARFEAERQALALMEHPNIAKILDAGTTATGRPFFVMELVRGIKITEFCDQNALDTRKRLELFLQVCQAVQHAHQKGIIHRDLKPSNILVTINDGVPVPKVIDFGIAKATEGRLTDKTIYTELHQFVGTPAYMSPEQALLTSLDIDTRSDIYSLGVLLYELLTGRTPFDERELLHAGLDVMRQTIREKEPMPPSTRLSTLAASELKTVAVARHSEPPGLLHLVKGDLDWIVMKCLNKDRGRRYETAVGLAMDVRRHLDNEPVLARPPDALYRLRKGMRRHKVAFTAGLAVAVALAAGLAVSTVMFFRERQARELARRNAYVSDMNLTQRALNDGDLGTARALLRRNVPRPHETDWRNWEWRYLAAQSQGDSHVALTAHVGPVCNIRFLDDDTLLTTGASDRRTLIWNLASAQVSRAITNRSHASGVAFIMALAPKRHEYFYRVGWATAREVLSVNLQTGTESLLFQAPAAVSSLAVSPDERMLAVAAGQYLHLCDLDALTVRSLVIADSLVTQVAFSPAGKLLATTDDSNQLSFWSVPECTRITTVTNLPPANFGKLEFSADGRWLVRPGGAGPTRIWQVSDRSVVKDLVDSTDIWHAVFSSDGRWLATIGGDANVRLWDTATWQRVRILRGHTDIVQGVEFSPNNHELASSTQSGEVKVWPLEPSTDSPDAVSLPPSAEFGLARDGSGFARAAQEKSIGDARVLSGVEAWSVTPLKRVGEFHAEHLAIRDSVLLPGGGAQAAVACPDGSLHMISATGAPEHVLRAFASFEFRQEMLDVSADGRVLAAVGNGPDRHGVRLSRLPQLELIAEQPGITNVHFLTLSADGQHLACFNGAGQLGVWKLPSFGGPSMWPSGVPPMNNVMACAFSPDNRRLAAAIGNGELLIWDLPSQKRTRLAWTMRSFQSLSFSPDGTRLAVGSRDADGKLFDAETGQEVLTFKPHGLKLAFTRDGETLLAVHPEGASLLRAPPLAQLQFAWLQETPSPAPPAVPEALVPYHTPRIATPAHGP